MNIRFEQQGHLSAFSAAAAIACGGMAMTGEAAAATGSVDADMRPASAFHNVQDLALQIAQQVGLETAPADHAVSWQVAQIITSSSKSSSTTSSPGVTQQGQAITNRILSQVLLGANEQINCSNCFSAFGSVGSFSAGAHGRYNITGQLSIRGGIAFSQYHGTGFKVTSAPIMALALRYDLADWGKSRPFFDVGVTATPSMNTSYRRSYLNFGVPTNAVGKANGNSYAGFLKGGWVFRLTPRDEAAVYAEVWRSMQHTASYPEAPLPPFGVLPATNDRINIGKVGGQWTHLWGSSFETHVNVGIARTFNTSIGLVPVLANLGFPAEPVRERTYLEYGLRVGYRMTPKLTLDVFANGASGGGGAAAQVHVGTALRYSY